MLGTLAGEVDDNKAKIYDSKSANGKRNEMFIMINAN